MSSLPSNPFSKKGFIRVGNEIFPPKKTNENHNPPPSAEPKQIVRNESVAETPGKTGNARRIVVSIKSFRKRLLDPDNLAGGAKYFLDGCRYAGLIPGDRPDQITLEVSQVKSKTDWTEITIT